MNILSFEENKGVIFSGSRAGLIASFKDILRFSDDGNLYDHHDLEYTLLNGDLIFSEDSRGAVLKIYKKDELVDYDESYIDGEVIVLYEGLDSSGKILNYSSSRLIIWGTNSGFRRFAFFVLQLLSSDIVQKEINLKFYKQNGVPIVSDKSLNFFIEITD